MLILVPPPPNSTDHALPPPPTMISHALAKSAQTLNRRMSALSDAENNENYPNRFFVPQKRRSEESSVSLPSKKTKVDALQMILENQRSFQLLMVKQQHAMQEKLLDVLGNNSLTE